MVMVPSFPKPDALARLAAASKRARVSGMDAATALKKFSEAAKAAHRPPLITGLDPAVPGTAERSVLTGAKVASKYSVGGRITIGGCDYQVTEILGPDSIEITPAGIAPRLDYIGEITDRLLELGIFKLVRHEEIDDGMSIGVRTFHCQFILPTPTPEYGTISVAVNLIEVAQDPAKQIALACAMAQSEWETYMNGDE